MGLGGRLRRDRRFDQFESRLAWIFGSPRSGSTWLLQLLAHPLVAVEGRTDPGLGVERRDAPNAGPAQAIPINEPYIPQHLTPPLFDDRTAGADVAAVTIHSYRREEPAYFLSDDYADVWRPRVRALVLARLAAQAEPAIQLGEDGRRVAPHLLVADDTA